MDERKLNETQSTLINQYAILYQNLRDNTIAQ